MATITISHPHSKTTDTVRQLIQGLEREMASQFGLKVTWSGNSAAIKRRWLSGKVAIDTNQVRIDVELRYGLSPLKGTVERRIREELVKRL
jgi:putative polyhydroxyalkanoate system protein